MKYSVTNRVLYDDGKDPYYQIFLSSYPFAKQLGNMHAEELTIIRAEADGKALTVGSILELVPVAVH